MKTLRFIWILCFLLTVIGRPSYSCTIVMASGPGIALAGSNEDSSFPLTLLWFTPASEGSYARVSLGYNLMRNFVQGGMNEIQRNFLILSRSILSWPLLTSLTGKRKKPWKNLKRPCP